MRTVPVDLWNEYSARFVTAALERCSAGTGETFALSLPPDRARSFALSEAASAANLRGDFTKAKDLLSLLTTPDELWPAISGTLTNLALNDPDTGRAWLLEMQPRLGPQKFAWAARNFNDHVIRVAPSLAVDPGDGKAPD
jgi:hypothetical protein